jgi:glycine C-acetyltransferase
MENLERATKLAEVTGGGILLLLKVFWMRGQQGKLKEIVAMKQNSTPFTGWWCTRIWYTRKTGAGAGEEQGVQDDIDVYFSTFAKSMANIGAFIAADKDVIDYLQITFSNVRNHYRWSKLLAHWNV